jgi:hypothetical protein
VADHSRLTKGMYFQYVSRQKLGIILQNKKLQKFKFKKLCLTKNDNINWKKNEKNPLVFDIENWLESTILAFLMALQQIPLSILIFGPKSVQLCIPPLETRQPILP